MENNQAIELLAPAGNMTCLHAAVRAGADAVYLGAGPFNARQGADNFSMDELREACDYAHLRGVKIYLTLNTVVLPSELPDAMELARQAYRAGVDAFIVQDPGIAAEITRSIPGARLHISTQMNTHDADGLAAVAALGAKRVTLARELALDEIAVLAVAARELGMEIETFGHGAICICYSGQCFMSSLIGGRSANRGRCAQACRLPYTLHNRALKTKDLPAPGEHLLSPKDLCTAELIPELIEAGVASLKVEGRMKSPEYVSTVVGIYRSIIDRTLAWRAAAGEEASLDEAPRVTEDELRELSEAFSRGFTTAYLTKNRGNEIMSYGRPNNRGVFVGRVTAVRDGIVELAPEVEYIVPEYGQWIEL
jgi:putative protease